MATNHIQPNKVLITGVSGGIGSAVAMQFAKQGAHLILLYHTNQQVASLNADLCKQHTSKVQIYSLDLSRSDLIANLYAQLRQQSMLPDIIVHASGVAYYGLLQEMSEDDWDFVMNVNLKSAFLLAKYFSPNMIAQKFGRIIHISSIWGQIGASCEVAYSATKGALNSFTKALAKELAPSGVTVNAIAPGAVDTNMLAHLDSDEKQQLLAEIPAGRLAQPDEIAMLVSFLASPAASYMNGQILSVNGGWSTA